MSIQKVTKGVWLSADGDPTVVGESRAYWTSRNCLDRVELKNPRVGEHRSVLRLSPLNYPVSYIPLELFDVKN
jgi:hypothetical protein